MPACESCGAFIEGPGPSGLFCKACAENLTTRKTDDVTRAAESNELGENRMGPYRLVRLIGEGGMGSVYLAVQDRPIRREVAIKLIKPGMGSREVLARFDTERQALAIMDHPNIATVFDAGATADGRPYFVMEHVPGVPITDYCDRHALSTRERLELFEQVCAALQHAHHKGVVHRDIKPSNVLITMRDGRPVPKVIDFGISKATHQPLAERSLFTEQGVLLGTPAYMSPEQAEVTGLGVDERTDVYSLGVLLYELLTGVLPFDEIELREAGYFGMMRILREQEPPTPSSRLLGLGAKADTAAEHRHTTRSALLQSLRGDLDWVALKALEKDRTRRYASASELAADVARYLQEKPVVARPPSASYRARKFARRNKLAVAAGILVAVALVGGLALGALLGRSTAAAERELASGLLDTARQTFDSFEYDQAVRQLDQVIAELAKSPSVRDRFYGSVLGLMGTPQLDHQDLLVQAHEMRARARFASGDRLGAEQDFLALLAIDPTHELDQGIAPRVRALFDQVRERR